MNGVTERDFPDAAKLQMLALTLLFGLPCLAQTNINDKVRLARVIVVSIPDRKLAVVENGAVRATFHIAVGAMESPSPAGEFQIINRISNPTYYHPGTVIPSGKNNPIGTRWVGLSKKGYGIHGTNAPGSVGRAASHGCIRLRNRDMERLFTLLKVGDAVQIRGERTDEVARVFGEQTQETGVTVAENTPQNIPQPEARDCAVGLGY